MKNVEENSKNQALFGRVFWFPIKFPPFLLFFIDEDSHPLQRPRLGQHRGPWQWTRTNPSKAIVPATQKCVASYETWKHNMNSIRFFWEIQKWRKLDPESIVICKPPKSSSWRTRRIYPHRKEEKFTKVLDIPIKLEKIVRTFIAPYPRAAHNGSPHTSARSRSTCRRASQPRQEVWRFFRGMSWVWPPPWMPVIIAFLSRESHGIPMNLYLPLEYWIDEDLSGWV